MAETLSFDLRLDRPHAPFAMAAEIPLAGVTAIVGPSGAGKTSLLRALAGLERAAHGPVRCGGDDWTGRPPEARGIGFVFQDGRLFRHLDVAGNLRFGATRRDVDAARLERIVAALDLGPLMDRRVTGLSGGEARRVALGRALAAGSRILFLDEPLSGLDVARKADIQAYIARAVSATGLPVLYVTHDRAEVAALADRVLPVRDGACGPLGPGAPTLLARRVRSDGPRVTLRIGERELVVEAAGRSESWLVRLGPDLLVSTQDPGLSSAAAVLVGRVAPAEDHVEIAGQTIPVTGIPAGIGAGTPVWLSIGTLWAIPADRPARFDA